MEDERQQTRSCEQEMKGVNESRFEDVKATSRTPCLSLDAARWKENAIRSVDKFLALAPISEIAEN